LLSKGKIPKWPSAHKPLEKTHRKGHKTGTRQRTSLARVRRRDRSLRQVSRAAARKIRRRTNR
jgi:hypothetical protein